MALILYHDSAATQPIDESNPDNVHEAVNVGGQIVDEQLVYVKSNDPDLTYEDVLITSEADPEAPVQIDVTYALDDNGVPGTYTPSLELPDGDFSTVVPVWRKVYVDNIQQAFQAELNHIVAWTEYSN